MVHFVGAGPGAVDLITVRGLSLLKDADVVIYAGSLVNPELLKNCKNKCEIHNSAYMNLEEVIETMKKAESEGKSVVRLHTGDPSLYGAIKEQIDLLEKYNAPNPAELIKKMLLPGEIEDISKAIELLSGYRKNTIEEIKKK